MRRFHVTVIQGMMVIQRFVITIFPISTVMGNFRMTVIQILTVMRNGEIPPFSRCWGFRRNLCHLLRRRAAILESKKPPYGGRW